MLLTLTLLCAPITVPFLQEVVQEPTPVVLQKVEPRTKVAFPVEASWAGGKTVQHLLGVGVRDKTIFKVKVYALGLYVDPAGAAKALAAWNPQTLGVGTGEGEMKAFYKKVRKDEKFYKALLSGAFSKTMRWVFVRDVDGEDIAEAFADSLEPRLKALEKKERNSKGAEERVAAATKSLAALKSWFTEELEEGTELVFAWHPGGDLVVTQDGKEIGKLTSRHVCHALFDTSLGEDSVTPDARDDFPTGLAGLFSLAATLPSKE